MTGFMRPIDRALLVSEWCLFDPERGLEGACPSCTCHDRRNGGTGHLPDCAHDQALSERGYPDQISRDRARELLTQAPTMSPRVVVEHCMGNDCADKAACECMCPKCCPPAEPR